MTQTSVLIVEDEGIVAEDLQATLIDFGYDAFAIAMSADEAIQYASARCPDVVLMDIRIKGARDGIETAAIMREQFGVPVVFLTAHADEATLQRAKQVQPYGYLVKPVRPAELRSAIEIAIFRSEMERRLRERERWSSTTPSPGDAVVTVDLAGVITHLDPVAEQLFGVARSELVGRPSREVQRLLDRPPLPHAPTGTRVKVDPPPVGRDEVPAALAAPPSAPTSAREAVALDDQRTLGTVMVFRDPTGARPPTAQRDLGDRLSSLGMMAANVAHEINNPLAVVVTNASFVTDELRGIQRALRAGAHATDAATVIASACARLELLAHAASDITLAGTGIARIVADLRAFTRQAPTSSGAANVLEAIDWALRTTAPALRLRATITPHLVPVPAVVGDDARLGQVLVNLLVNASQAIAPGDVPGNEISISTHVDGEQVVIEIRDTGSGISEEVRARMFEPFFTTRSGGAAGLGLSICHGIVTSLGGSLQLESAPGHGTTARLILRAAPTAHSPATPAPVSTTPARHRILAIDDEPMVLRAITRMLRVHDVVAVASAEQGLELLAHGEAFDLIFSDLMMPTMTGIAFYETLLARSKEVASRVVFITGGAVSAYADDFLQSVTNEWIEKPFEAATLQALVARRLSKVDG